MRKPLSPAALRTLVTCALAVGIAGMGMNRVAAHMRGRAVRGYAPASDVPRIPFSGDPVREAMLIRDFDVSGDTLYLLDGAAPRVLMMRRNADHWQSAFGFGRRGGGPGELLQPTGIAVLGDTVVVVDRDRIHYFTRSGSYRRTRAPTLPCPLMEPHVYGAGRGLILSGRCMRADTITAELLYVDPHDVVRAIAHDALYTTDGAVGSMFGASNAFSPGIPHGLFGGGTGDCVQRISQATDTSLPTADPICGNALPRYAFEASPEFAAKARAIARARPFASGALAIPQFLPPYIGRMAIGSGDLVLRPFSNDSLAFRFAGSAKDIAVTGVDGFVGCRAGGCLWMRHDAVPEMMLVPEAVMGAAVRQSAPDGARKITTKRRR